MSAISPFDQCGPQFSQQMETESNRNVETMIENIHIVKKAKEKEFLERQLTQQLWNIVLPKLKYQALENLCNACLYFRDSNLAFRTLFLVRYLAPILIDKYHNNHHNDKVYDETTAKTEGTICELCQRERRTRWFSGLLNLRLVSRDWCIAIDNHHKQINSLTLFTENVNEDSKNFITDNLSSSQKCLEFLLHFASTHANTKRSPFIGRSVYYDQGEELRVERNADSDFRDDLFLILSLYGKRIKYFSYENSLRNTASATTDKDFQEFRAMLKFMTHLEELDVKFAFSKDNTCEQKVRLYEQVKKKSLPTLQTLKVLCCSDIRIGFLNLAFQKNGHISKLILKDFQIGFEDPEQETPIQDLEELSLYFSSEAAAAELINEPFEFPHEKCSIHIDFPAFDLRLLRVSVQEQFYNLECFLFLNSPLTNMELTFGSGWFENNLLERIPHLDSEDDTDDSKEFTHADIESLDRANRNDDDPLPMGNCHLLRLSFDDLEFFKIRMGAPMSLDFLMPSKKTLKTLEIELQFEIDDDFFSRGRMAGLECLSVMKFFSNFRHSNEFDDLWKVFEALRRIKVSGCNGFQRTFSRESRYSKVKVY